MEANKIIKPILIAVLYFLTGWLGLKIPFVGSQVTLIWLPTGISVVALLRWNKLCILGIFVGAFSINYFISPSVLLSLSIAVGNTLSPLIVALLLKKYKLNYFFIRSKDTLILIIASSIGMIFSSLGGTLSLYVSGLLQAEDMFFAFLSWWMGDTLGVLLIAPLLLSVSDKSLKSVMQNKLEVILWILISIPASYFALNMFKFPIENIYNFEYLVLLMVVWAGLRFGIVGSSFSVLLFSIIASINTALGYGNFTISLNNKGLLSLWFFVLTNVVAGLIMSAIQAKQRQSEDEIKLKNEELNKINQEKDKFFSIVAHDLRSPLSTVNGFSELMIERISLKEYDHIVEYAHFIKQSSDRALNLLSNLMEWSVVQTGRITYTPELINIVDLLNENILLLKETANIKSIDINTDYSNIVKVNVDKYMINTIVRNLISNAIKFTPKNGTITIKTFEIGKNLTISFSDTGVGMQDEQLNNLFKLNNSFSTVGTAGEKGTGLGLILCKEFIEKHKGKISVESTLGKGAIFNIIIPFC